MRIHRVLARRWVPTIFAASASVVLAAHASAQPPLDGRDGRALALDQFRPTSMLQLPQHIPKHAKYPVVDVHTHFQVRLHHAPELLDAFVHVMDRNRIAICASMDGKLDDVGQEHSAYLWTHYLDRFVVFVHLNWQGQGRATEPATWDCHRPDFARRMVDLLAQAKQRGASGLKIFKGLGLEYRNPDGSLIEVDDPRWDPIWHACGELGLPILIHTADPAAFFRPVDATNERWEELHRRPDWSFANEGIPSREALLTARNRVIARHPDTIFIAAHVANNPEDLATVAQWLDTYPNMYLEIASRIAELGRQPYTARKFLIRYADRVMFGTDGPQPEARLKRYFQFLETFDEYFPYSEKPFPPQGLWQIYGVGLPDDVLRKIYFENAARVIPGVQERLDRLGRAAPASSDE